MVYAISVGQSVSVPDLADSVGLTDNLCLLLYLVGNLGLANLADSLQLRPNLKDILRFASNVKL